MVKFELEKLPYENNALEPFISKETLEYHHEKHHQAYTDNFNKALEEIKETKENINEILSNVKDKPAIRNNGGGFWNHNFYFESLTPNKTNPNEILLNKINETFGSFEDLKNEFSKMAKSNFGSGWTWLAVKKNGELIIYNTPNQDNFMMDVCKNKETPILVIDIWEHAYYIDYRNKRPDYIEKYFNIINWDKVSERFEKIISN